MKINEIFYSIQGESTYQGKPCIFIRTTGCNLRCTYCDTQYAYDAGEEISLEYLLLKVRDFNVKLVEITGGEPLIQKDVPELIQTLIEKKYKVLLETNGSIDIDIVNKQAVRIVDMKCPSSGMHTGMKLDNLKKLGNHDELKFVIGNREDYEWAKKLITDYNLVKFPNILFQPVHNKIPNRKLVKWILDDKLKVRFQLQLHKIIWGEEVRGR